MFLHIFQYVLSYSSGWHDCWLLQHTPRVGGVGGWDTYQPIFNEFYERAKLIQASVLIVTTTSVNMQYYTYLIPFYLHTNCNKINYSNKNIKININEGALKGAI